MRITFARKKWASAAPIPTDPEHPARRWLAARHLWRPDLGDKTLCLAGTRGYRPHSLDLDLLRRWDAAGLTATCSNLAGIGPEPPFSRSTAKTRRAERPVAAFLLGGVVPRGGAYLPRPLEPTEGERPARPCPAWRGQPLPRFPAGTAAQRPRCDQLATVDGCQLCSLSLIISAKSQRDQRWPEPFDGLDRYC